jgi:hypothetical protein
VRAVVRYPAADGAAFTPTNTFVMPVYTALPNGVQVDGRLDGYNLNTEIPMDDGHTLRYPITVQRMMPGSAAIVASTRTRSSRTAARS